MRERKYDALLIVEYFKEEILKLGYENVSIRDITRHFDMSVSSIYRYFQSKEEILDAVLAPFLERFNGIFNKTEEESYSYIGKMDVNDFFDAMKFPVEYFDFLYEYKYEIRILLSDLKGTKYEDFFKVLVEKDVRSTLNCLTMIRDKEFPVRNIDENVIRILSEASMNAYLSIFKYDFTYEYAKKVFMILEENSTAGYKAIFTLE